ncbi:MAG: tricarballylate utilization 4Fe-4S protein TcuB [Hyphomicrobiales bacterium]|nr:tricarballylate utilization 4Fe-4S protein TcuB [Hyphomicrobiales bacterium]
MHATDLVAAARHASADLAEADRLMTICNSCRYCEGLCAVFPAMEMRQAFADGDLNYLANLCHGCGACFHDCQFSPPHEFNVNVPLNFSRVRARSYARYAWPSALSGMFARNGLATGAVMALAVTAFLVAFARLDEPSVLFGIHEGQGAFYDVMPHGAMVLLFGIAFVFALVALAMGARRFWRDIGEEPSALADRPSLAQAARDVLALRYLDGGGVGCMNKDERPTDRRRLFHHLTFYGFIACFAATCVATLYHYLLGREAPYPIYDLPVLLGTLGGIGLVIGSIGLLAARWRREPAIADAERFGMDAAFTVMLFLVGATGLSLLALRGTSLMGIMLALHLGVVFALFITMPYGKFVHGIYRFIALLRYAKEKRILS